MLRVRPSLVTLGFIFVGCVLAFFLVGAAFGVMAIGVCSIDNCSPTAEGVPFARGVTIAATVGGVVIGSIIVGGLRVMTPRSSTR